MAWLNIMVDAPYSKGSLIRELNRLHGIFECIRLDLTELDSDEIESLVKSLEVL